MKTVLILLLAAVAAIAVLAALKSRDEIDRYRSLSRM